jgi:hypothetical protein
MAATTEGIEARVREFYGMLERGDPAGVSDYISRTDDVVWIGTDPDEWWVGYDTVSRVVSQQVKELGRCSVEGSNPRGATSGDAGWVADQATLRLPDGNAVPMRLTFVYRREEGVWRAVQVHASIGVSNEEAIGLDLTT